MPLAAGQTLSFYEILGPLGAGAMGEVYRAKDTRLWMTIDDAISAVDEKKLKKLIAQLGKRYERERLSKVRAGARVRRPLRLTKRSLYSRREISGASARRAAARRTNY